MLFALAFAVMAGVLGLVLDGGRIYYERNRVQMAADAGAIGECRNYAGATTAHRRATTIA
ncbi:MAG: pilus assembly protein TadG-related protein [Bryobacterales bacterium]